MCDAAYGLYETEALREAKAAADDIGAIDLDWLQSSYHSRLQALVEPLGVPGLLEVMEILDYIKGWEFHRCLDGPIAGPMSDLLEASLVRWFTDLSPAEAMWETKSQIAERMERKLGPLKRHLKRWDLEQRIRLWCW